jgi:hypothetical protein
MIRCCCSGKAFDSGYISLIRPKAPPRKRALGYVPFAKQSKSRAILKGTSFADLRKKQFSETKWIVENLIAGGLTVLTGGSKIGKSWLALQLAVAVDCGGCFFGKLPVRKSGVIYFALEDTEERIQRRLDKQGLYDFNDAWLETGWGHKTTLLKSVLQEHPEFKVVIIETLQKFAKITDIKDYTETVDSLTSLKKLLTNPALPLSSFTTTARVNKVLKRAIGLKAVSAV